MSDGIDESEIVQELPEASSDPEVEMMIDQKNDMSVDVDPDAEMQDDSPQSPESDNTVSISEPVATTQSPSPPSSPAIPDLIQGPAREASDSIESPSQEPPLVAINPVFEASDSALSPVHEVTDSAQSTIHEVTDSAQSPIHEVTDSAQSPIHEVADSAQSPMHEVVDSAQSPVHEVTDSAQSPMHEVMDSAQSPVYEPSDSAQSPSHQMNGGFRSPSPSNDDSASKANDEPINITIQDTLDSALSPPHETFEAVGSPSTKPIQSPIVFREIPDSAQSPTHETSETIQSPSHENDISEEMLPSSSQQTMNSSHSGFKRVNETSSQETDEQMEEESEIPNSSAEIHEGSSQEANEDTVVSASEEEIDLEDGEIEDDEDEDMPVIIKEEIKLPARSTSSKLETPSAVIASILPESESKSKSSRSKRHGSREKSKEKDGKSSKDKENKKEKKKRRHSKEDAHGDKSSRPKRNRKAGEEDEGPMADEDDYLFVRGASPTNSSPDLPSQGKFFEGEVDAFGRRYDEPEAEFDEESRRRKRSRSPQDSRRGMRNRRPNSGRKDMGKPAHKSDQICAYYMQGKCQKTHEECAFSHNAVPPRKMELCKFWMMECCAKKEKCLYLHNDFPCKYYHTGLVCKLGLRNQCKFSHKPLNEVTKAVLLKHIETAPKEILGDFPRLNRNGALNLIGKMEAKINGELERLERAKQAESENQRRASAGKERDDDHRRRSRWEQPTHEDEVKLQSLMEEAGIENYYTDAVNDGPSQNQSPPPRRHGSQNQHHQKPNHQQHQNQNHNVNSNPNFSMIGMNPMMLGNVAMLPNQLPPMLPGHSPIVHNSALADVLDKLQIPSTTIHLPPPKELGFDQTQEEGHVSQYQKLGKMKEQQSKLSKNKNSNQRNRSPPPRSPTPPHSTVQDSGKANQEEVTSEPPEHLPPMQKELFRRIQEQQLKNQNKSQRESESDDEKPDDHGWYSSDEETEKSVPMPKPIEKQPEIKPVVDFASVLSAIRQKTAAAQSKESSDKANSVDTIMKPESSPPRGRGDVDLRYSTQSTAGQGPFGDTDFRLPSLRPEFKDIDLRMGGAGSPAQAEVGRVSPVAPVFKSMPTGPATMIDASVNSHPPMTWKVSIAAGVRKPDYNYIRHTLTPSQMSIDPRFGPRTAGGISILPDPSSPPPATSNTLSPATIPGGDLDPRVRRGQAQGQQTQQAVGDPRFGRDPRSGGQQAQQQQNMMPPGWPTPADMTQAAIQQAAQYMAAQQLGLPLLSFPNPGGLPFPPPDFGVGLGGNNNISGSGRPPFHGQGQFPGQNQFLGRPPSSSWERMQSSGGVTPPL